MAICICLVLAWFCPPEVKHLLITKNKQYQTGGKSFLLNKLIVVNLPRYPSLLIALIIISEVGTESKSLLPSISFFWGNPTISQNLSREISCVFPSNFDSKFLVLWLNTKFCHHGIKNSTKSIYLMVSKLTSEKSVYIVDLLMDEGLSSAYT